MKGSGGVCEACGSLTTRACGMCGSPVCYECAFLQYEGGTYIGSLCEDCYQP